MGATWQGGGDAVAAPGDADDPVAIDFAINLDRFSGSQESHAVAGSGRGGEG